MCRKSGKENFFRCTYVLPDGVSYTRGFVKNPDDAKRYLSLSDEKVSSPSLGVKKDVIELDVSEKTEDKKRIDLTKNVNSHTFESIPSFSLFVKFKSSCFWQEFDLTNERFLVPEMIFHPADLGRYHIRLKYE